MYKLELRIISAFISALVLSLAPTAWGQSCPSPTTPVVPLTPGTNGDLYGLAGGELTDFSSCTVLAAISGNPSGGLIVGSDGYFYGMTISGGSSGQGSIYRVSQSGTLQVLHSFSGLDGEYPSGALVQGLDGNLYGTTSSGGASNFGAIFKYGPGGFAKLYDFSGTIDGSSPSGSLIQLSDGYLYGNAGGEFFKFNISSGELLPIARVPSASELVVGSDGNFYGLDFFKVSTAGVVTTFTSVESATGGACSPADPVEATSGTPLADGAGNIYVPITCPGSGFSSDGGYGSSAGVAALNPQTGAVSITPIDPEYPYGECEVESQSAQLDLSYGTNGALAGLNSITSVYGGDPGCPSGPISYASLYTQNVGSMSLAASVTQLSVGQTFTLTWSAANAFSATMQQCYAFGAWSGQKAAAGTQQITVKSPGVENFSLVCGGQEVAIATINAGVTYMDVQASNSPIVSGSRETLTATVMTDLGLVSQGTVVFTTGRTRIGSAAVNANGQATITASTAGIAANAYTVVAQYEGNANYTASSSEVTVDVLAARYPTSTTLIASGNSFCIGNTASGAVQVSGAYSTIGESVLLRANGMTIATVPLTGAYSSGNYAVTVKGIPSGSYSVVATYPGDALSAPSSSAPVQVTVLASPTVTASATPNPVSNGQTLTLGANVGGQTSGAVAFYFGQELLGLTSLNESGSASVSYGVNDIPSGTYPIHATFEGNSGSCAGTSSPVVVTVQ